MDGFGLTEPGPGNAVANASTPNLDRIFRDCPGCKLSASGLDVGCLLYTSYSGERDIFEVIGGLITDSFCSSEIHKLTKGSSVDLDMDMEGK